MQSGKKVQETEENSPRELLAGGEYNKYVKSEYKSSNKIVDIRVKWTKFLFIYFEREQA